MTMRIEIKARRLLITEAVRRHVVRQLEHALRHWRVWVESVEVQIGKLPRPAARGGRFCRVLVRLAQLPAIVIMDLGADLYAVIDEAAAQAGRDVDRRMALRLRTKRRFGMLSARSVAP
jgi:ribosome-associated translation inhibitor RaiA